ncbi:MAG: hypothetical protein AAFY65_15405 [Pseudomonadota bacterium]
MIQSDPATLEVDAGETPDGTAWVTLSGASLPDETRVLSQMAPLCWTGAAGLHAHGVRARTVTLAETRVVRRMSVWA